MESVQQARAGGHRQNVWALGPKWTKGQTHNRAASVGNEEKRKEGRCRKPPPWSETKEIIQKSSESRFLQHHRRSRSSFHPLIRRRVWKPPVLGSQHRISASRLGVQVLKAWCLWTSFNLRSRIRYSIAMWSSSWSALRHDFETSICTSNSHFRSKLQHLIAMDSHSIELDFRFWITSSSSTRFHASMSR